MFRLETERLFLRAWRDDDLDALAALNGDPEVMRYITGGVPRTREQAEVGLRRQQQNQRELGYSFWAVEERATGRVIGLNGIQPLLDTGEVEIGWWLARDKWGQGFASEAARRAAAFAFDEAGLQRLVAIAMHENGASLAIMAKLGMTFERATTFGELGSTNADLQDIALDFHGLDAQTFATVRAAAAASATAATRHGREGDR